MRIVFEGDCRLYSLEAREPAHCLKFSMPVVALLYMLLSIVMNYVHVSSSQLGCVWRTSLI